MSSRSGSPPQPPASSSAESHPAWLAPAGDDTVVRLHVQPGATRSGVAGLHGGALKIRVRARPVEGAANREIVALLAEALAVRAATVRLESGEHGRDKRIRIMGLDASAVRTRLAPFIDKGGGAD